MGIKINDSRLRPKKESTFGQKKPFKSKSNGRNRKGNTKKNVVKTFKHEPLNPNKPVRFPEAKYRQRQEDVRGLGKCQVCEMSYELDAPHHVEQGSKKDDRYLINICIDCHGLVHVVGYSAVKKTREECKVIAWSNHELFEKKDM